MEVVKRKTTPRSVEQKALRAKRDLERKLKVIDEFNLLKQHNDKLKCEKEKLQERLEAVHISLEQQRQDDVSRAERHVQESSKDMLRLQHQNSELQVQLQQEHDKWCQRLHKVNKELITAQLRGEAVVVQLNKLHKKKRVMKEDVQQMHKEKNDLYTKLCNAEKLVVALKQHEHVVQCEATELRTNIAELKEETMWLCTKLAEQGIEAEQLHREVDWLNGLLEWLANTTKLALAMAQLPPLQLDVQVPGM